LTAIERTNELLGKLRC